jgi:hypothetical protein
MTKAMMRKTLKETFHLKADQVKRVLVFIDKKVRNLYIEAALRPVTLAQNTGVALRLKSDVAAKASERVFVPFVCTINLDNAQAYACQGLGFHSRGARNCRICVRPTADFYPRPSFSSSQSSMAAATRQARPAATAGGGAPSAARPSDGFRGYAETSLLGELLEEDFLRELRIQSSAVLKSRRGRKREREGEPDAVEETATFSELVKARAKGQNIGPMKNPLDVVLRTLVEEGVMSYPEFFPADKLHTWDKGPVDYAIR